MNQDEAKQILMLYRPGTADAEEPEIVAAMEMARQHPGLGQWFNQHAQFQQAMRSKLRQIKVPEHLKAGLLARDTIIRPAVWWVRPMTIRLTAAAAVILLCVGLGILWTKPADTTRLVNFQERIISQVQRQYVMEWKTSDMGALRQSIQSRGGRADYQVPRGVLNLKLTGGGVLNWHTNPVSMVCFDRGGGQMLFLFVVKKDTVKDPPPELRDPRLAVVHEWLTASWTEGDNTYVLAGQDHDNLQTFARKYL